MNNTPKITISADDFGASVPANIAICDLITRNKIHRVGVMIFDTLTCKEVHTLKNASIKIDIHLHIPQLHQEHTLHANALLRGVRFLRHLFSGKISPQKIADVWESQIIQFYTLFGRMPDGINSHEHTHLFPPYFHIVCKLATTHRIPFVRCSIHGPAPRTTCISAILSVLHLWNTRTLKKFSHLETTSYMTSFDWIENDLSQISTTHDDTELIVHPERPDEYAVLVKYELF